VKINASAITAVVCGHAQNEDKNLQFLSIVPVSKFYSTPGFWSDDEGCTQRIRVCNASPSGIEESKDPVANSITSE
jgi:hypothetical protein